MINNSDGLNIVIIIQARTSSSRLPDKTLLPICGKEMLVRMVERVMASDYGNNVVVATTVSKKDDVIVEICRREKFKYFRGDENDLLDRHFHAALHYNADVVVKIPSDCPLIDPTIINKVINYFIDNFNKYDFVSNLHPQTYPDGNDVEVFRFDVLETAWRKAKAPFQREHTTPYIWDNPDKFRIGNVEWETGLNYSMSHRFTIDYPEDYEFIKAVYDELYNKKKLFSLNDILNLLDEKKEIFELNKKYAGVNWYRNYIKELKTVKRSETKII